MSSYLFQSRRFGFREMVEQDAANMLALNADPEVLRFTGDVPFANLEAARQFTLNYDQYRKFGMGRWCVVDLETNEFLGWCGLKTRTTGKIDVGYRLLRKHWGKGIASEAGLQCLHYGFERLGIQEIIGEALIANPASVRVLQKMGMRFCKELQLDGQPGLRYILSAIEFQAVVATPGQD